MASIKKLTLFCLYFVVWVVHAGKDSLLGRRKAWRGQYETGSDEASQDARIRPQTGKVSERTAHKLTRLSWISFFVSFCGSRRHKCEHTKPTLGYRLLCDCDSDGWLIDPSPSLFPCSCRNRSKYVEGNTSAAQTKTTTPSQTPPSVGVTGKRYRHLFITPVFKQNTLHSLRCSHHNRRQGKGVVVLILYKQAMTPHAIWAVRVG